MVRGVKMADIGASRFYIVSDLESFSLASELLSLFNTT